MRCLGEAVLNLSQGTVSEILAKPRPWSALSIKGREPYLRMYSWFHDTNNVQKLLQWKRDRDGNEETSSTIRRCFPCLFSASKPSTASRSGSS